MYEITLLAIGAVLGIGGLLTIITIAFKNDKPPTRAPKRQRYRIEPINDPPPPP